MLLLGGAIAGLVSEFRDDDGDIPADALAIGREPVSYRIVYEVHNLGGGDDVASTEVLEVRRPFDARTVVRRGRPPGDAVQSVDVHALGGFTIGGSSQRATVVFGAPGPPPVDPRLAPLLPEGIAVGLLERGERREIKGRPCDVYRVSGEPRVELCVDESGLVLEEQQFDGADVVRRKTAVVVDERPELDERVFRLRGDPLPPAEGGGSFMRLTDDSRPPGVDFWELAAPPDGFRHRGRFAVVESIPGPSGEPGTRLAIIADVYVSATDVVVVENGGTTGGAPFGDSAFARGVSVGALGRGDLVLSLPAAEVRVELEQSRFVRVAGTLEPDDLVAIARDLRRRPPGTLTTIPG